MERANKDRQTKNSCKTFCIEIKCTAVRFDELLPKNLQAMFGAIKRSDVSYLEDRYLSIREVEITDSNEGRKYCHEKRTGDERGARIG